MLLNSSRACGFLPAFVVVGEVIKVLCHKWLPLVVNGAFVLWLPKQYFFLVATKSPPSAS